MEKYLTLLILLGLIALARAQVTSQQCEQSRDLCTAEFSTEQALLQTGAFNLTATCSSVDSYMTCVDSALAPCDVVTRNTLRSAIDLLIGIYRDPPYSCKLKIEETFEYSNCSQQVTECAFFKYTAEYAKDNSTKACSEFDKFVDCMRENTTDCKDTERTEIEESIQNTTEAFGQCPYACNQPDLICTTVSSTTTVSPSSSEEFSLEVSATPVMSSETEVDNESDYYPLTLEMSEDFETSSVSMESSSVMVEEIAPTTTSSLEESDFYPIDLEDSSSDTDSIEAESIIQPSSDIFQSADEFDVDQSDSATETQSLPNSDFEEFETVDTTSSSQTPSSNVRVASSKSERVTDTVQIVSSSKSYQTASVTSTSNNVLQTQQASSSKQGSTSTSSKSNTASDIAATTTVTETSSAASSTSAAPTSKSSTTTSSTSSSSKSSTTTSETSSSEQSTTTSAKSSSTSSTTTSAKSSSKPSTTKTSVTSPSTGKTTSTSTTPNRETGSQKPQTTTPDGSNTTRDTTRKTTTDYPTPNYGDNSAGCIRVSVFLFLLPLAKILMS